MTAPTMLLAATAMTTGLLAGVFAYLYSSAQAAYLKYWSIHWSIVALLLMMTMALPISEFPWLQFGITSCAIMGSVYLYFGALELTGRRAGDAWKLVVGAALAWAAVGATTDLSFIAQTLPIYWVRGGLEIWAGILILRLPGQFGPERFVPGIAFIADGLHLADYPLLADSDVLAPWAFMVSIMIRFTAGLGMLLIYFRQVSMERDALQAKTLEAARLEAMGHMAGGVAHDFNNVLTVIAGHAELLEDDVPPEGMGSLEAIKDATERATALTGQLLAFGRRRRAEPRPVDLSAALEGMEGLLKSLVTEGIELTIDIDPEPGDVNIDPSHLDQIIINLVVNARDAINATGAIRISSRKLRLVHIGSSGFPTLKIGDYHVVTISDDGEGMDEATLERAFEPLFTIKAKDGGTGLSLATVYQVTHQAGGAIRVESHLGEGTTFEVALPCFINS